MFKKLLREQIGQLILLVFLSLMEAVGGFVLIKTLGDAIDLIVGIIRIETDRVKF